MHCTSLGCNVKVHWAEHRAGVCGAGFCIWLCPWWPSDLVPKTSPLWVSVFSSVKWESLSRNKKEKKSKPSNDYCKDQVGWFQDLPLYLVLRCCWINAGGSWENIAFIELHMLYSVTENPLRERFEELLWGWHTFLLWGVEAKPKLPCSGP